MATNSPRGGATVEQIKALTALRMSSMANSNNSSPHTSLTPQGEGTPNLNKCIILQLHSVQNLKELTKMRTHSTGANLTNNKSSAHGSNRKSSEQCIKVNRRLREKAPSRTHVIQPRLTTASTSKELKTQRGDLIDGYNVVSRHSKSHAAFSEDNELNNSNHLTNLPLNLAIKSSKHLHQIDYENAKSSDRRQSMYESVLISKAKNAAELSIATAYSADSTLTDAFLNNFSNQSNHLTWENKPERTYLENCNESHYFLNEPGYSPSSSSNTIAYFDQKFQDNDVVTRLILNDVNKFENHMSMKECRQNASDSECSYPIVFQDQIYQDVSNASVDENCDPYFSLENSINDHLLVQVQRLLTDEIKSGNEKSTLLISVDRMKTIHQRSMALM